MKRTIYFLMVVLLLAGGGWNLGQGAAQGNTSIYLPLTIERTAINLTASTGVSPFAPHSSADGEIVAFLSEATTLVQGDGNAARDAFVWYRATGTFRRVSVASNGTEGNAGTFGVWLSGNGRYVLFLSEATNLVPNDTTPTADLYRHDLLTGNTELVSVNLSGGAGGQVNTAAFSADGNTIAFTSLASMTADPFPTTCTQGGPCYALFVRDMTMGITTAPLLDTDGTHLTPIYGVFISSDGQTLVYARQLLAGYYYCDGWCPDYGQFIYRLVRDGSEPTLVTNSTSYTVGGAEFRNSIYLKGISADATVVGYWGSYSSSSSGGGGSRTELRYRRGTETEQTLYVNDSLALPAEFSATATGDTFVFSADGNANIPGSTNEFVALFRYTPATGSYQQLTRGETSGVEYPVVTADGGNLYFVSNDDALDWGDDNGTYNLFKMTLP